MISKNAEACCPILFHVFVFYRSFSQKEWEFSCIINTEGRDTVVVSVCLLNEEYSMNCT